MVFIDAIGKNKFEKFKCMKTKLEGVAVSSVYEA